MNNEYWSLTRSSLSEKLSAKEMVELCSTMVKEHCKKGQRIGLNRPNHNDVYFLHSGIVKIINLNDNGEEIIKYIVNEGETFGILGLTEGENSNDYAIAIEDSNICIFNAITLKKMMNENAHLSHYLFKMAGIRIKKLEQKLESLIHKDAKTRVKDFILDYLHDYGIKSEGHLVAKNLFSNKDVGKLTCTSRQTVNKTLNTLKINQIIDFDEKTIRAPEQIRTQDKVSAIKL